MTPSKNAFRNSDHGIYCIGECLCDPQGSVYGNDAELFKPEPCPMWIGMLTLGAEILSYTTWIRLQGLTLNILSALPYQFDK
jgi:hypothetical protein